MNNTSITYQARIISLFKLKIEGVISNEMLIFFFFLFSVSSYPFYIENTGAEYGITGEDINIIKTWNKGIFGNQIRIKIFGQCCDINYPAIKEHFIENCSFNFFSNSSNLSICNDNRTPLAGTTIVSTVLGDTFETESQIFYGIANKSMFSFTVPTQDVDNISIYIENLRKTSTNDDDIILDIFSRSLFKWQNNERIFYKRHVKEVDDFIKDTVRLGRKYKGKILVVPITPYKYTQLTETRSLFENYPETIVVSPTDYRGGSSPIPTYSTSILVNAPTCGNPDVSYQKFHPFLPIASENPSEIQDSYKNITYPYYAGIVTGCVSLLLEYNPDLSYRDIQYILLLSSEKNDPLHPYWMTNAAGFHYNPIYGFGRVNIDEAIRISEYWSNSNLPSCTSYEQELNDCNFDVPNARNGKLELKFNIKTFNEKAFTENVIFQFNLSFPDISLLRIVVTSPSGTKVEILKPDPYFPNGYPHEFYAIEPYQILARNFLGEDPNGEWIVEFIDSSFLVGTKLNYVKFVVEAMDTPPTLPDIMPYTTSPSGYPLQSDDEIIKIHIDNLTQVCGVPFNMSVTVDDVSQFVPLYLIEKDTHLTIPYMNYERKTDYTIKFPCNYETTEGIALAAQLRDRNLFTSVNLDIINDQNETGFISPEPYENIPTSITNKTYVELTIAEKRNRLPVFGLGTHFLYAMYDLDTNTKIIQKSSDIHSKMVIAPTLPSQKPEKAIIIGVPFDMDEISPCNTYILPLSFRDVDNKEEIPPFALPLNDYCPIPKGILTDKTINNESSFLRWLKTKGGIIIASSVSLTFVLVLIMLIIMCRVLFRSKRQNALDDQILLPN